MENKEEKQQQSTPSIKLSRVEEIKEDMKDNNSSDHSRRTNQTPSAAENAAFIALFEQFYAPGLWSSQWEPDLRILREAPNPRALAASHHGDRTRAAMEKVRNAEAEAKSLADQVQLDTPAEGDCLFWAVMLGALIRAKGTDRFEAVVLSLFGKEPTPVDAKQLREVLLPSYQGCVSDITSYDTAHDFHGLMMRFRTRVAKRIAETKELHEHIEDDVEDYCQKMSTAGTWGGEIEIKAMAALLGMDIIVHRGAGSPMHRMLAVAEKETGEALHIAHVPASAESSVRNHYHFYVPEANIVWPREVSLVEQADCKLEEIKEENNKTPCLRQMDINSISAMRPFLTIQEQVSLFISCKALHENSRLIKPNKLLYLVARGEQNKAEAMIKKNPELLLQSADVTDGAGRYFKNITALQYAVWALDAHMWTMMLPYFDRHHPRDTVIRLLRMLEEKGTAHGHQFDFSPLLTAYQTITNNWDSYGWGQRDAHWCKVIREAQLLPNNVAQEYTTPDRPLDPIHFVAPMCFDLRATMVVFIYFLLKLPQSKIPEAYIFMLLLCIFNGGRLLWNREWSRRSGLRGSRWEPEAVQALYRQRLSDLSELLSYYNLEGESAPERKSPGHR